MTRTNPNSILRIEADQTREILPQIVDVYRDVFSQPPYNSTESEMEKFADSWPSRCGRPGFIFLGAHDSAGTLVGFTYGWTSTPGDRWNTEFKEVLGASAEEWLSDCFEYVDLAVHSSQRGLGIGRRLTDEIFSQLKHKTALLLTHSSETVASGMYQRDGWKRLADFPSSTGSPLALMGKRLR